MFGDDFHGDYVIRQIRQLMNFVARIAGFNGEAQYDKALATAERAWGELLDAPPGLLDAADTPTLAALLRDPVKIRYAAQLRREEARALAGKGDPAHAALRYCRALELILEARAIDPQPDDEAAIIELSRVAPIDLLDPRYRSRLR
jgi:hypothetical protein